MTCRHPLGVWADNDGNINYKYDDTEGLYPVERFKFCPDCGVNLQCDHVFELQGLYDPCNNNYKIKCIKCGFVSTAYYPP